ncbi:glycoprotein Xg [Ornithorhynchus anatinus]|uniref:glycoprotein Xg n=1 Tax=Ornithorhynchus anatinus TaxID=9258 RepID=UPI0019D4CCCD|nr:glycoprotein Xg [Ornithorhynchus anatinus]
MGHHWVMSTFLLLAFALTPTTGQRDFDLADALDPSDDVTRKPYPVTKRPVPGNDFNLEDGGGGEDHPRPQPPRRPQPGHPSNAGGFEDSDLNDGRYPPKPRPRPPGGGGGYSNYGTAHGNTIAQIVSPIVSVAVVSLIGAATSYFAYQKRRSCFRTNDPVNV